MTRLPCCVPFCRRTTGEAYSEWICGSHWRLVPRKVKLFRRRADAALDKAKAACASLTGFDDPRYVGTITAASKTRRRSKRAWERCKRHAIEGGVGL